MKTRRNLPVNTPRGRCRCTSVERSATAFAMGRCTTRFTICLPPGVLARLLARKSRLVHLKTNGFDWPKAVSSGSGPTNFPA